MVDCWFSLWFGWFWTLVVWFVIACCFVVAVGCWWGVLFVLDDVAVIIVVGYLWFCDW